MQQLLSSARVPLSWHATRPINISSELAPATPHPPPAFFPRVEVPNPTTALCMFARLHDRGFVYRLLNRYTRFSSLKIHGARDLLHQDVLPYHQITSLSSGTTMIPSKYSRTYSIDAVVRYCLLCAPAAVG